ncbi:MAG: family hydrolase [Bacteroidetes bacterium]|nr:family hydrolase [Bacteroidota bacterium]
METIFTKIIKGEIPCYKVAENEHFFAFLDISPIAYGHTLVVSKLQNDYIFDLNDNQIADLMVFAKKVAVAVEKNVTCKRIGIAVIGLEVPHTHIHLVPISNVSDLDFKKERVQVSKEEMINLATKISASFME